MSPSVKNTLILTAPRSLQVYSHMKSPEPALLQDSPQRPLLDPQSHSLCLWPTWGMDAHGPLLWIISLLTLGLTGLGPAILVHTENRRGCSAFARRHLMGALQELDFKESWSGGKDYITKRSYLHRTSLLTLGEEGQSLNQEQVDLKCALKTLAHNCP